MPPRKPASRHLLEGTARSGPNATNLNPLSVTDSERLRAPRFLSKEAKREFNRVVHFLEEQNAEYLSRLDTAVLATYAVNYAAWVSAESEVEQHGNVIEEPLTNKATGNIVGHRLVQNPSARVAMQRQAAMLKSIQALGFDPRSRQSVDRTPIKKSSKRTSGKGSTTDLITQVAKGLNL